MRTRKPDNFELEHVLDRTCPILKPVGNLSGNRHRPTYRTPCSGNSNRILFDDYDGTTPTWIHDRVTGFRDTGKISKHRGETCMRINNGALDSPGWNSSESPNLSLDNWTLFVDFEAKSFVGTFPGVWSRRQDTAPTGVQQFFIADVGGANDYRFGWTNPGNTFVTADWTGAWANHGGLGIRQRICLTYERTGGTTNVFQLYINGKAIGAPDAHSDVDVVVDTTNHPLMLGVLQNSATTTNRIDGYFWSSVANIARTLNRAEAIALTNDPYGVMCKRQNKSIFHVPAAAAGLGIPIAAYHYNHNLGSRL